MTTARIELPPKLIPVFAGEADVRGAYGGRGSGKTRSFAKMSAVRAYMWAMEGRNGQVLCGRQFMKTLADSSLEEIKQAILETDWLKPFFDIGETYVRTTGLPGEVYYTFMWRISRNTGARVAKLSPLTTRSRSFRMNSSVAARSGAGSAVRGRTSPISLPNTKRCLIR